MTKANKQSALHHAGPRRRLQPNGKRSAATASRASATLVRRLSHAKATGIQRTARVSLRAMACTRSQAAARGDQP